MIVNNPTAAWWQEQSERSYPSAIAATLTANGTSISNQRIIKGAPFGQADEGYTPADGTGVYPGAAREFGATFEEGISAVWLSDLLQPYVAKIMVGRARTRSSNPATKMTASMPVSWPICYVWEWFRHDSAVGSVVCH
jgi:hypothetical protein